jgi:hypothetical protein
MELSPSTTDHQAAATSVVSAARQAKLELHLRKIIGSYRALRRRRDWAPGQAGWHLALDTDDLRQLQVVIADAETFLEGS